MTYCYHWFTFSENRIDQDTLFTQLKVQEYLWKKWLNEGPEEGTGIGTGSGFERGGLKKRLMLDISRVRARVPQFRGQPDIFEPAPEPSAPP